MSDPYRFPGMPPFVAGEGLNPSFAAKVPGLYFVARVSDALGQIPEARPEHRAAMYAVAREAIAALSASLVTAVAAFDDVMAHCPPPPDPDDPAVDRTQAPGSPDRVRRRPRPAAGRTPVHAPEGLLVDPDAAAEAAPEIEPEPAEAETHPEAPRKKPE